ncbi:MAG: MarR family winged helix-turn-helix transcriptional regulator [Acidimicrobiia bacterium]
MGDPLVADATGSPTDRKLDAIGLVLESAAGIERVFGRRLERDAGISIQWFDVLVRLVRTPGHQLRMSDLAAQTTLSVSGLTRAVDRLVEAGLVVREACTSDRRVAYATLTDAGRERIGAAIAVHSAHVDEVLGGELTTADLEALAALLRKLRALVNPEAARASACPPG